MTSAVDTAKRWQPIKGYAPRPAIIEALDTRTLKNFNLWSVPSELHAKDINWRAYVKWKNLTMLMRHLDTLPPAGEFLLPEISTPCASNKNYPKLKLGETNNSYLIRLLFRPRTPKHIQKAVYFFLFPIRREARDIYNHGVVRRISYLLSYADTISSHTLEHLSRFSFEADYPLFYYRLTLPQIKLSKGLNPWHSKDVIAALAEANNNAGKLISKVAALNGKNIPVRMHLPYSPQEAERSSNKKWYSIK